MEKITEKMLDGLRKDISKSMSEKRLRHTLEVEKMAARLGELYAPDKIQMLRAAALLHDITKEKTVDEQILLCAKYNLEVSRDELFAPKTFHAKTAAAVIKDEYPDFADEEIISAVRWHTTGRTNMSLCEMIVYLADYIDMSRTFEDCVKLRAFFFDAEPQNMGERERLIHLYDTMLLSYDMTIYGLLEKGVTISINTFEARNDLLIRKREL